VHTHKQTVEEEPATRLPKFEPALPSTPPLSPRGSLASGRGKHGALLGFDLLDWSGLAQTCGLQDQVGLSALESSVPTHFTLQPDR